ncbi:MAG: hypothetical protein ACFFCX_11265 [Candidatus Sifarchaeia archaeon]
MTDGPIRTGSFIIYRIMIFLIVIFWSIWGFEIAQVQLLRFYEIPFVWIGWAVFVFVSLIPGITAVTWRMKTRVSFKEPIWDFREREVSLTEYEKMVQQYQSEYRNFLSIIDYSELLSALVLSVSAVTIPFLLMRTTILLIAMTPVIFGFIVLLFGLLLSSIMFKFIPNDVTPYFPLVSGRSMRPWIALMQKTPGISWAGVSLTLGEAAGYYTIRNVVPIARIEGIESAALIKGMLNESGHVSNFITSLKLNDSDMTEVTRESSDDISPRKLTEMVYHTIKTYINATSADDILDEVLDEITHFLKQLNKRTD